MRSAVVGIVLLLGLVVSGGQAQQTTKPAPKPAVAPTLANVAYGKHERQVLDFWKAKSATPTPLVLFIHAGSWHNGDKSGAVGRAKQYLDAGISVASINYRFVQHAAADKVEPPVKAPMDDAARALQFIRSRAGEWNVDKKRIGALGGSAGACSALWLALHDDMADPKSDDPVARESTRLFCVALIGAQTSLDPKELRDWIPNYVYGAHAFGLRDFQALYDQREKVLPWIKEYSPMEHLKRDAPPIFMEYSPQETPPVIGTKQADPTHSAIMGIKLAEKCKTLGVEVHLSYPGHPDPQFADSPQFLIDRLNQGHVRVQELSRDVQTILSKCVGVYTTPPTSVGALDPSIKAYRIPDGPLMGNGDLAVAVGGTSTEQTFYLSKSDLSQSMKGLGGLTYSFAGEAAENGKYRQEQDLYKAEVRSRIPLRQATVKMRSWTSDSGNLLVTDLWTEQGDPTDVAIKLWSHANASTTQAGTANGLIWSTREINGKVGTPPQPFRSSIAMTTRILGATPAFSTNGKNFSTAKFTLPAGKFVRIVTVVSGGYNATDPVAQGKDVAASLTNKRIDELCLQHLDWWEKFWEKSHVSLNDDLLEKFYYGALYVLGCSSRAGNVPPGLAGPWHLHGPACWSNRYTLDYNFEATWWGVYSSNRPELAMPYYDVILKLIPAGRQLAKEHGTKGILFGVNAHAWGGFTDTRTLNMKGNASLAALNFTTHYRYTQDESFLVNKAWPLLKELAIFWEDNLEWDDVNARWVIRDSGAREGGKDTNAITDLAYVASLFRFLLDTADILEGKKSAEETIHITDEQKRKWRSYVKDLSKFPTILFDGKTVFKEAENRNRMSLGGPGDNSDVLNHVFPAGALSMGSDPELLQIARNTVAALNPSKKKASWFQANCFPKIYTQAIRSGYPAAEVIAAMKQILAGTQPYDDRGDHVQLRKNLTIVPPVHGIESVGAIEAINSMLLQSHDDTIRLFPAWIKDKDARFKDLRAYGGFLVSSEYKDGRVTYVDIQSEAGKLCKIANPCLDKTCQVWSISSGQLQMVDFQWDGNVMRFTTEKGKKYRIATR